MRSPFPEGFKRSPEKVQIIPLLILSDQFCPKSAQGHIGDCDQTSKSYTETPAQFTTIIFFKR
jgi:hypothetical protein